MKYTLIALFGLGLTQNAISQTNPSSVKTSIHFESGKHELLPADLEKLDILAKELALIGDFELDIKAYTDDIGDTESNRQLAARRAQTIETYLRKHNLHITKQEVLGVGELGVDTKKTANLDEQRRQNRRVDIQAAPFAPQNLSDVFNYLSNQHKQYFTCNSSKDTFFVGKNGTVLHLPAQAFAVKNSKNGNVNYPIQIELREAYSFADMLSNNLSTGSDSALIETGGMFYVDAKDSKGQSLSLAKSMDVSMPSTRELPEDMQVFTSDRAGADNASATNWKAQGTTFASFPAFVSDFIKVKSFRPSNPLTIGGIDTSYLSKIPNLPTVSKPVLTEYPKAPERPSFRPIAIAELSIEKLKKADPKGLLESSSKYEARIQKFYEEKLAANKKTEEMNSKRQLAHEQNLKNYEIQMAAYHENIAALKTQNEQAEAFMASFLNFYNTKLGRVLGDFQRNRSTMQAATRPQKDMVRQAVYLRQYCRQNQLTDLLPVAEKILQNLTNLNKSKSEQMSREEMIKLVNKVNGIFQNTPLKKIDAAFSTLKFNNGDKSKNSYVLSIHEVRQMITKSGEGESNYIKTQKDIKFQNWVYSLNQDAISLLADSKTIEDLEKINQIADKIQKMLPKEANILETELSKLHQDICQHPIIAAKMRKEEADRLEYRRKLAQYRAELKERELKEFENSAANGKFNLANSATYLNNLTSINQLGWVNCDRFAGYQDVTHFEIPVMNSEETKYFVVMPKENCIINMTATPSAVKTPTTYSGLPAASEAKLIGIRASNGTMQIFTHTGLVSDMAKVKIQFKPAKISELRDVFAI